MFFTKSKASDLILVLFGLKDFSRLVESPTMTPELLVSFMNVYISEISGNARNSNGSVVSFIADSILCAWEISPRKNHFDNKKFLQNLVPLVSLKNTKKYAASHGNQQLPSLVVALHRGKCIYSIRRSIIKEVVGDGVSQIFNLERSYEGRGDVIIMHKSLSETFKGLKLNQSSNDLIVIDIADFINSINSL